MNCKNCGAPLNPTDEFCGNCGTKVVNETPNVEQNVVNQPNVQLAQDPISVQPEVTPAPLDTAVAVDPIVEPTPAIVAEPVEPKVEPMPGPAVPPIGPAPVNPQPLPNEPQKKNNSNNIIIIILVVLLVAALGACAFLFLNNKNDNNSSDGTTPSAETPTTSVVNNTTYNLSFGGYTFEIPSDLKSELRTDGFIIGDSAETWLGFVSIGDITYSQVQAIKGNIIQNLTKDGLKAANLQEKTYSGISMITVEVSDGTDNSLFVYTALGSKTACIEVYTQDNSFGYTLLDQLASVISTAKQGSATASLNGSNIDTKKITDAILKK